MFSKHTRGPWEVEELEGYITGNILGMRTLNGKRELIVGNTPAGQGVQRRADAELIAKAPEMYDALHALGMLGLQSDRYGRDVEYRDAVDRALVLTGAVVSK